METSPSVKELQAALCDFQKGAIAVQKNAENPGFKRGNKAMKYADLNSILAVVLPALTAHGLAITQMPDAGGLTTRLMHISGEWMQATSQMQPVANTPQALGSAITYARRYALGAMLGIVTEDDDDGNAASAPPAPAATPPAPMPLAPESRRLIEQLVAHELITPEDREKTLANLDSLNHDTGKKTIAVLTKRIQEKGGEV